MESGGVSDLGKWRSFVAPTVAPRAHRGPDSAALPAKTAGTMATVFLRREAFDRIEALRAQQFGKSAVAIQQSVRGVQARAYYHLLKEEVTAATVIIRGGYLDYCTISNRTKF